VPRSLHRHVNDFGMGELFQSFLTLFSPDTGMFGAAEGHQESAIYHLKTIY
jgi:hypothetical protein